MFKLINVKYKHILSIDSLIIPGQKITCIVGQSGSGKTTLLRLLNNLISCDNGEIYYNDISLNDIEPIKLRRKVVMLPQTPLVFPGTISDNLQIGLRFCEHPPVSNDVLIKTLEKVHLNKKLTDDANLLSGGEKQRLALGRVMLLEPDVFLLDEPSSALDETTEHILIRNLVKHTKENNKTLIMVTHSISMAETFADCIIHIEEGKVTNKEAV